MTLSRWLNLAVLDATFPLPLDQPFTAQEARREGVTRDSLSALCDAGLLRRPLIGVYVGTQAGDSVRIRAASLMKIVPPDCVVCDRHAAWIHGAAMALAPNEHVELRPISVFRPSGNGRLRNALADSGERNLQPRDITVVDGVQLTTPLRTAADLGRQRNRDRALAGLDVILRLGVDRGELVQEIPRYRGMRWVTRLRELAPLADGRSQSPGESVLRLRWLDLSLPTPTPQVPVVLPGGRTIYLDVGNEELLFAGEYEGVEWHSSPEQRQHDRSRRLEAERHRNWLIEPVVAANVFGPQQDIDVILQRGVAEARRRRGLRVVMS
jgi:hypothetical protein